MEEAYGQTYDPGLRKKVIMRIKSNSINGVLGLEEFIATLYYHLLNSVYRNSQSSNICTLIALAPGLLAVSNA